MNERAPIRDRTLILRILVPGLEARLRDKMREMEETAAANRSHHSNNSANNNNNTKESLLDLEGVTAEPTAARNRTLWHFHCDGATYPAHLVNLPCPVEIYKTHDHAAYYKASNTAQMLIVYEDDMALEEADEKAPEGFTHYYHSGLTPPNKRVVERRFAARDRQAVAPPRAAVADVEAQVLDLMEQLAKDEKTKRNKVPLLTSAVKVLEEVTEEVVDYEAWMDDFGRVPEGVELEADDALASVHPEIWLSPEQMAELQEQDAAAKRKKQAAQDKKQAKRKEKKQKELDAAAAAAAAAASSQPKKGIASRKNTEQVDEVTQAAASMLMTQEDLLGAAVADDDFFDEFNLEDEDMNFEGINL